MEAETVSMWESALWTAYGFLAPAAAAAVVWASGLFSGLIRTKMKNEHAAGILVRLNESVADAVLAVNQQTRELLGKAREPSSPGGRALTAAEARHLKSAAVNYVLSYWGEKGIRELAKVLGLTKDTDEKTTAMVRTMVDTKVEAAVNKMKRGGDPSSIVTRMPVPWNGPSAML